MIYLDHGATSFPKPPAVQTAVQQALRLCANPGRSGHGPAMAAAEAVYTCREEAAALFTCRPEQVVFTASCTHGLNIALRSLVRPGAQVVVSGFEHNAVMRPLYALDARITVAGRRLFDPAHTLQEFENALRAGASVAVFTHVSNVFGYILPVEELARLCKSYGVPFIIDAAQSAGMLNVDLQALGADFIAMPGHKGLLGPQGTGILLCADHAAPLLYGGTGTNSREPTMPRELPERLEAGTVNVPGIAGLCAGIRYIRARGREQLFAHAHAAMRLCADGLQELGYRVFDGEPQAATVSFVAKNDCEELSQRLADAGIAVRGGLHCAPLAHDSAGTLETGTVRLSFGHDTTISQCRKMLRILRKISEE